ncbi:hypothetical protein XNA1_40020 [Xenorhabdus nematophila str. Anatoliense]|nr:hypothetical protein XNA1_2020020 [Xenorhabdus nematophila str. Anatoliense]CEE93578.1 hypothetical protein XNA1_40020 [Xenorhabdus nematophila str. Anatoliense]
MNSYDWSDIVNSRIMLDYRLTDMKTDQKNHLYSDCNYLIQKLFKVSHG